MIDGVKGIHFAAQSLPDTFDDNGASIAVQNYEAVPECSPDPVNLVTKSEFVKELGKIWSKIKSKDDKLSVTEAEDDTGGEDNNQLVSSLKQKNQKLSEEICILKAR